MSRSPQKIRGTAMKKLDWSYVPIVGLFRVEHGAGAGFPRTGPGIDYADYPGAGRRRITRSMASHSLTPAAPSGRRAANIRSPFRPRFRPAAIRIQYAFRDWEFAGGSFPYNPLTITATPSIGEYKATFEVQYGLGVAFFSCPDPSYCPSPGTIVVNGLPINSSQDVYVSP